MGTKPSVLIADDEEDVRYAVCKWLQAAGYDTFTASNGEQALETALREMPNAIVLDIRMPLRSGLEALLDLKHHTQTRHIPIVMLSASIVDQHASLEAGARFFISKPYQGKHLVDAVEQSLNEQQTTTSEKVL